MDLGDFAMDLNFEGLGDLYSADFGMVDAFDDASTPHGQQPGCDMSGDLKGLNFTEIEMEASQPGDEGHGSFDAQGIQATTVAALLNQFENTSAASSHDSIQFHDVTDDSSWTGQRLPSLSSESIQFHDVTEDLPPLRTQSLPASRVCSASASPVSTPPGTPPPDVLHKIRSSHNQASKRKATIMLPYAAPPAKRGRGKAAASTTPQANGCSSKLQRILSRNNSTAASCEVDQSSAPAQPAGFQPVKTEGLTVVGGHLSQPRVSAVSQTAGGKAPVSAPTPAASSVSSEVRMHRVTDPAVAQSILSKTPRALSLLAGPISSETLATATQPKLCLVQNGTALNSGNALQILNLKNSSSGFVSLLHNASSDLRLAVAPQNNKVKSVNQNSSALKGTSTQSQVHSAAQPVNAAEDETSRKCNIVLSRGAENIRGEGLQSVLDHDYCRDSLRRVIVDEFDLDISPSKGCSQKPLQKVQSLPIITANLSGKLQVSNINGKSVQGSVVSRALEIKNNKQSEPVRALAVSLGSSQGSSNIAVANPSRMVALSVPSTLGVSPAASSSKVTASPFKKKQDVASALTLSSPAPAVTLTAIKKKPDVVSTSAASNPAPFPMALVSALSKMQNLESLFTLENGTLKLHPSVTASLDPAALASLSQENSQHTATPVAADNVSARQKANMVQQNSPGPVAQQPMKRSVLIPSNNLTVGQNGLKKPLQLSAASTSSFQIVKPLTSQAKISVSKPPTLVNKELQNSKVTFHPSVSTTSVSASTPGVAVSKSSSPAKQGTLSLSTNSSNNMVNSCNGTSVQKDPFPQQSEGDRSLHPKKEMRDLSGREALCADSGTNSRTSRCDPKETRAPQCSRSFEKDAGNVEASVMADFKVVIEKAVPDKTDDLRCGMTAETSMPQTLYSMPNFELDGFFNSDLSERVVPPVESHSHSDASPAVQKDPSPIPSPSSTHTCDQNAPALVPPHSPVHGVENNHLHSSLQEGSPEAETSHEPMYHYSDDFTQAWEEQAQLMAERSRVNQDSKPGKYRDKQQTPDSDQAAGTSCANSGESSGRGEKRKSQRSRGGKSWKQGKSPVKKDDSGLFSKIPSYYTALSIPMKTGRKQLTAEAAESTTIDDSLPADDSSAHPTEDTEWYSKLPPYFSCFTNSTKYDRDPSTVKVNGVGDQPGKPADDVNSKRSKSPKSSSPGSSYQPRLSSPARSPERSRWSRASGRSPRSCKRKRSNSSSGSSRSGSRRRSWKPRKRRRRRSPSVSGSYHSSSGSHSRSSSRSRSRSRSSRSRSRSRSGSRRRYRSRSVESRSSGSRGRNDSVSTSRHIRKQLRREDKIKKMEERKIVYVGRIPEDYTRRKLYERFERFGKIEDVSVHFRETGDNYGFVTYYDSVDAFRAIDKGNSLSGELHFELCFGGRRHFCANEYADLDGNRVIEEEYTPVSSKDTMDFDELLRQAQRKLKK